MTISRKRNRQHPPNCTVSDLNPSRFLAFRAKQNEVEAEYGFRLGVPRHTDAEREGYSRYMRDWRRRYGEAHREARKAYRHAYWLNVTKRGFDSLAEAVGDEAALKRKAEKKAAKERRVEYEERKRQIHKQYGFWLNTPPRTPEEAAGRDRYRKDRDALRKERNHERILAYQKMRNAKRREENERKFQDELKRLAATDPVAAERFRARHETLCRIQQMTPEERVRYREQREAERRKAQAARAEARKQAREEARRIREERKAEERRLKKPKAATSPRLTRRELWLREMAERRKEREAQSAALAAMESELRATYAAEREANRKAYLERKNVRRVEDAAPYPRGDEFVVGADVLGRPHCAENIASNPSVVGASVPARPHSPQESSHTNAMTCGGMPPPPPTPPTVTTGGEPPEDDDVINKRERDFIRHQQERVRKEAAKKRKATIARKRREAAAQAAREAQAAERESRRKTREEARQAAREAKQATLAAAKAARVERKSLLKQGLAAFGHKVRAFENKKRKMRKSLGLPEMKRDFTPEQRKTWNDYLREGRAELQNWLVERMRHEQAKAQNRANAETPEERARREKEREERKRLIREKYGFTLGKSQVTPEEVEGFKRWQRDQAADYRKRHHDTITAYNRDYRRRKRAEALAKEQTAWTSAQWKAWRKREADKACPPGSPSWLVREVVNHLAKEQSLSSDAVMGRLIELGGLDFLIKGAESMGRNRCNRPSSVTAAVRALALYLDPDRAEMFGGVGNGERGMGNGKRNETRKEHT